MIVGCVGGGSNFAGLVFPFIRGTLRGENSIRYVAAEPAACPTLTRGVYAYDFGDTVGLTPLMPMHTLGHDFVPPPLHAGGLRYHGAAPMISGLVKAGVIEARAYRQNETFEAAVQFSRTEGIIPAPESAHAIRAAIVEALAAKEAGEERTILFGLSGHGHFDLAAYDAYLAGTLEDPEFSEEDLESALAALPANTPAIASSQRESPRRGRDRSVAHPDEARPAGREYRRVRAVGLDAWRWRSSTTAIVAPATVRSDARSARRRRASERSVRYAALRRVARTDRRAARRATAPLSTCCGRHCDARRRRGGPCGVRRGPP